MVSATVVQTVLTLTVTHRARCYMKRNVQDGQDLLTEAASTTGEVGVEMVRVGTSLSP